MKILFAVSKIATISVWNTAANSPKFSDTFRMT